MNPVQNPSNIQSAPSAARATSPDRLSLAALGLGLSSVAAAAACAFGIAQALGTGLAWVAPLAAAAGALVGLLPLSGLMLRRLRAAQALADRAGAMPVGGMALPLFMDLAQREWARARRYGSGAALLLIDVDRYARLCEARGPHAGGLVLAEILRLTVPTLRPADIVTRYAETQIAVLLAQSDATGALDVAERIRERTEQIEVSLESAAALPQKLRVTVSAGVAPLRASHLSLQALIDDAEEALAAARQAGGNCVRSAPIEPERGRSARTGRGERRAQPRQDGPA